MCVPGGIEVVASEVTVHGKESGYEAIFTVGTDVDERNGHPEAPDGLDGSLAFRSIPLQPYPAQRWKGLAKSLDMWKQS
ncbi:hypothetical protein B0H12DRAFT_1158731 [Mycena haematopus]|nr:hypothetical protein B0H12DRAFT_1158731 [Mycena haematopus]